MPVNLDQHFMTDLRTLEKIVRAADISEGDRILEVGAGTGNLTRVLVNSGAKIIAVELDEELACALKEKFSGRKNVEVMEGNALKLIKKTKFDKIVSNIPYAICEPLLQELKKLKFEVAVLTVPAGFAKNMASESRLGLETRIFFDVKKLFAVPSSAFAPEPDTESVVVSIKPTKKFILRAVLLQPNKLVKNAIMEALILRNKCTKNQAREAIKGMKISNSIAEKRVEGIDLNDLRQLVSKLKL